MYALQEAGTGSTAAHLLEEGDVYEIHLCLEDETDLVELGPNTEFELNIMPESGSVTVVQGNTPSAISEKYTKLFP